jgi:hypothetical protein
MKIFANFSIFSLAYLYRFDRIHPCRKQSGAAKGMPHSEQLPRLETWNRQRMEVAERPGDGVDLRAHLQKVRCHINQGESK